MAERERPHTVPHPPPRPRVPSFQDYETYSGVGDPDEILAGEVTTDAASSPLASPPAVTTPPVVGPHTSGIMLHRRQQQNPLHVSEPNIPARAVTAEDIRSEVF